MWEYMYLNIVYTPPFNAAAGDNYEIMTENCRVIPEMVRPKKKAVWDHVNSMGREGWELVSVTPLQMHEVSSSRIEFHYVFKRPIEE